MPFLRATVMPPDADETIVEHLHDGLFKLATTVLAKASDVTSVLIEPVRQSAWFVGGARTPVAAHVVITVTSGTNTPEQKAAFVEQTFALLRNLLGSALPEATYVVVDEAAPASWGFGGKTVSTQHRA